MAQNTLKYINGRSEYCGTNTGYSYGCRCSDCKAAHRAIENLRISKSENKISKTSAWRLKNSDRNRRQRYAVYNLTEVQWDMIFQLQEFRCACCRSPTPNSKKGWHTDHYNIDGKPVIRGILCANCNPGLGHFKHDIGRLACAILYLDNSQPRIDEHW